MKKKAVLALTLAGLVALQVPMVAMADTTHKHGETVVISDDQENKDITITGNVIAVKVVGNETCNVKNITAEKAAAIVAQEGAAVTADSAKNSSQGAPTVSVDDATVTVDGAVTNEGTGGAINANNGATVTAESVTNTGVAVNATQGTLVVKVGSVESKGTGVVAEGENYGSMGVLSTVIVENDVKASNVGVSVEDYGTVVVEGTITGGNVGVDAGDFGYVYAYEIKTGEGGKLVNGSEDHIYYIIKQEAGNRISNIEGTKQEQYSDYKFDYAQKDNVLKVTVAEGYELKAGQIAVTLNADGSYSVTVPEGGGVTLDTVLKAVEQAQAEEEKKATVTGSEDSAVSNGQWNVGPGGYWTYRNNGIFKDTWGYITLEDGRTGWFYFDKNGVMATGWKEISGKWYYFNEAHDGTYGMMLVNTTTPDGKQVGADGAMIQ